MRLTAEDGYQAQRSYSIASEPESAGVTLTVERIDVGEVSPYLAGEARAGDLSFPKIISGRIDDVIRPGWHCCKLTDPLGRSPQRRILLE